jgi:predicted amidohydrolase
MGTFFSSSHRYDRVLGLFNLTILVIGYNFKSLRDISPFLEPSGSGISSLWARTTALRHNCVVVVGYPEKADVAHKWPSSPEYYNSAIVVNAEGETIANYRKTHLYYTDETWALESSKGFFRGFIPGLGQTAMGICKLIYSHLSI